jgi:hypothetical protein
MVSVSSEELDLLQVAGRTEPLTMLEIGDCAEEMAWVPLAQRHVQDKARELSAMEKARAGLISFEQFLHREPGVPNRVLTR